MSKRVHSPVSPAPLPQIAATDGPRDEPGRSSQRQPADLRRANPPPTRPLTNDAGRIVLVPRWLWSFVIVVVIVAFILPDPAAAGATAGNAMESITISFKA